MGSSPTFGTKDLRRIRRRCKNRVFCNSSAPVGLTLAWRCPERQPHGFTAKEGERLVLPVPPSRQTSHLHDRPSLQGGSPSQVGPGRLPADAPQAAADRAARRASTSSNSSSATASRPHGRPPPAQTGELTLAEFRDRYLATNRDSQEKRSIEGIELHFKHLVAALGERFPIGELKLAHLQGYVDRRAKAKGMYGRRLSPATIKKEIVTLRTAWNWAVKMGLVAGRFPNDGLRYPKLDEKPPFMTREEIERQIAAGGLTEAQKKELWNALFLTLPEVAELLEHLRQAGTLPWVYPMACFAAHTGARRSELLRMRVADIDFAGKAVLIHEKKRVRGKRTTRRVPLSPFLTAVLKDWLASHPGGQYLFCNAAVVNRSKKRSRMTGYKGDKTRASTANGRLADVKEREGPGIRPDHRRRGTRPPAALPSRKPMERDQGLAHCAP